MPITEEMVFEKLKNVLDPELFVNIVDLGLIYEIKFDPPKEETCEETPDHGGEDAEKGDGPTAATGEGTRIQIDMTMTSPACPAGPQLINGAVREVRSLDGVADVVVKIVLDPPWTPDRMTEDAKDQLGIF
ncbi:MAG: metal-sulfur cluster assembly factor [Pirellulales bacterium]|nr:metal-sulfur cluster assembly factor [Pirellulales bacterium]